MLWAVWGHFQGGSLCLTSSVCCFFRLTSSVVLCGGGGRCCKQIALSCAHSVSAPLDLSLLTVHKPLRLYDAQPGTSEAGPRLRAPPRSKLLRFSAQVALRGSDSVGTAFCGLPRSE